MWLFIKAKPDHHLRDIKPAITYLMTHDTESNMSSAVSISGVESLSDDGSTLSIGGGKTGVNGNSGNGLFDLGDGDLHIKVRHINYDLLGY